uniref:Peptidase M13 N-terminal domain-containing protein n=1 Tax=Graphocephala atropunctata TaxID=36148 RepID=A0A1B6KA34_9HEMI
MIPPGYIFVALLGFLSCKEKEIKHHLKNQRICKTHACKEAAKQIISYMDTTVKPCDDFYRFACGRFVDTAEIHSDKVDNSTVTQVDLMVEEQLKSVISEPPRPNEIAPFRSLKRLFSLCMDEEKIDARGVGPALTKLKAAGGWPVLGNWGNKKWNFLDTYIRLRNSMMGHTSLFQIDVEVDIKNNSRRIIMVDQPSLGLAQELLVKGPNDTMVKAYFNFMVDIAVLFGANKKTALKELRSSLHFEIELAKVMTVKEERRDYTRMYNFFILPKLTAELGWDWDKLLRGIMPKPISIRRDEVIIVVEVQYMRKLKQLLRSNSIRQPCTETGILCAE